MSLEVLKLMIETACENGEINAQEFKTLREKATELGMQDRDLEFLLSTSMRKKGFPEPDFAALMTRYNQGTTPAADDESGFLTQTPPPDDDASGFLTSPLPEPATPTSSNISESAGPAFTHITDLPGQGGMSVVQKAQLYGKWVVIKRLKPELKDNPKYLSLFNQEFENVFHLEHDHVIRTLGRAEDEQGPYYWMEFVDGRPLTHLLNNGPMPQRQARRIFSQMMEALDYVHKKQLVHRDLKPDNILITYKGDSVKIIDFGLAAADAFEDDLLKVGTPKYAAPEQATQGNSVNQTADLYSAGLIYYEMLTGHPVNEIDLALVKNDTDARIIERCLRELPADRFSGAWEILELLEKEISGFSTQPAEPEGYPEVKKVTQTEPPPPREINWKLWIGIGAAVVAVVAVVLGVIILPGMFGPKEKLYVISDRVNTRSEPIMDKITDPVLPFGYAVEVENVFEDWVTFTYKGNTRYLPSRYLGTQQEYLEIDALYGNAETREIIKAAFLKRAINNYFTSHSLIGDLSTENQLTLYGSVQDEKEVWQIYGLPRDGNEFNVLSDAKYSGGRRNDVALIISSKYNRRMDRKLLVFSFDGGDNASLLTTLDLRNYPGYYIKTARKDELGNFSSSIRNKIRKGSPVLMLGKNEGSYIPYVYLYENGNFQIYAGREIKKRY